MIIKRCRSAKYRFVLLIVPWFDWFLPVVHNPIMLCGCSNLLTWALKWKTGSAKYTSCSGRQWGLDEALLSVGQNTGRFSPAPCWFRGKWQSCYFCHLKLTFFVLPGKGHCKSTDFWVQCSALILSEMLKTWWFAGAAPWLWPPAAHSSRGPAVHYNRAMITHRSQGSQFLPGCLLSASNPAGMWLYQLCSPFHCLPLTTSVPSSLPPTCGSLPHCRWHYSDLCKRMYCKWRGKKAVCISER